LGTIASVGPIPMLAAGSGTGPYMDRRPLYRNPALCLILEF